MAFFIHTGIVFYSTVVLLLLKVLESAAFDGGIFILFIGGFMKRKVKCIWVHFKGDAYAMQFWDCKTLGDCLRRFGMKRSSVSSWWREYED